MSWQTVVQIALLMVLAAVLINTVAVDIIKIKNAAKQ